MHFVDFAKGYDRRCWLACGDMFALPSHDENFCIAVIEAVASGTFALVSPFVGAIDYLPSSHVRAEGLSTNRWVDTLQILEQNSLTQIITSQYLKGMFAPECIARSWFECYQQELPNRCNALDSK